MARAFVRPQRSTLPGWVDDLNGEWRAVELLETFDEYEERRTVLEKLVDGQYEFAYRTGEAGVTIYARVSHPYEVMVGLRPGAQGYMGKHVPLSDSHISPA